MRVAVAPHRPPGRWCRSAVHGGIFLVHTPGLAHTMVLPVVPAGAWFAGWCRVVPGGLNLGLVAAQVLLFDHAGQRRELVFRSREGLLTKDECSNVIKICDDHAAKIGGWGTVRYAPPSAASRAVPHRTTQSSVVCAARLLASGGHVKRDMCVCRCMWRGGEGALQ